MKTNNDERLMTHDSQAVNEEKDISNEWGSISIWENKVSIYQSFCK